MFNRKYVLSRIERAKSQGVPITNYGVALAKQGGIRGVAIASRNGSEYLRSIPDGKESNNLGDLPSTGLRGLS